MSLLMDKLKKITLENVFIIYMLLIFLTFLTGSYIAFFISLSILTIIIACYLFVKRTDATENKKTYRAYCHVNIFNIILSMSIFAVVFRNINVVSNLLLAILYGVLAVILFVYSLICLTKVHFFNLLAIKNWFKQYWILLTVSVIIFVLSIDCFFGFALWDSNEYFTALNKISINNFNELASLKLCYHTSIIYSIIVYIVYCAIDNIYFSVMLFNILCNIASLFVVFKLLKHICPNVNNLILYLCSGAFAFAPMLFGMSPYLYLDTVMMYGVLFFLYCFICEDDYLVFLSSYLAMFSKEFGVFIVAILVFVRLLIDFIKLKKIKNLKQNIHKLVNVFSVSLLILGITFMLIFLQKNWTNSDGWLEYGISFYHIYLMLESIFLINFTWVFALFILLAIIIKLIKIQKQVNDSFYNISELWPIILTFSVSLMINSLVITWEHLRYYNIEIICLYLLGILSVVYDLYSFIYLSKMNIKNKKIYKFGSNVVIIVLIILTPILMVQSYFTIDPIMHLYNGKIDMGTHQYVYSAGYKHGQINTQQLNDNMMYNKQMLYYTICMEKSLQEINFMSTDIILKGKGCHEKSILCNYSYDNKLIFNSTKDKQIKEVLIDENTNLDDYLTSNNKCFFIDFNMPDDGFNKNINYYLENESEIEIKNTYQIYCMNWHFTIYELEKID